MGNRLSKIVTRTGDNGTTGLGDGSRCSKSSPRMNAIGDIDELNCVVGLALVELRKGVADYDPGYDGVKIPVPVGYNELTDVQHRLFDLGGELSIPNYVIIDEDDAKHLETILEKWNDSLPYLKNFILPGGTELVARLHHARAVCRKAERSIVALDQYIKESNPDFEHYPDYCTGLNSSSIKYINRLSDFLFVLARVHSQGKEVLWVPKEKK